MEAPIATYKYWLKTHGLLKAKHKVYDFYMKKYFNAKAKQTRINILKTIPHFISGQLYTYVYDPKYKDVLDWYDKRPIILSLRHWRASSTNNHIETGINLNFIPYEMRVFILESLWKVYKNLIKQNEQAQKANSIRSVRPLFIDTYNYMELLDYIFNKVNKTGWKFAIRNYIYDRMTFAKCIDYSDYGKALFIDSKDITGAPLAQIYHEYWEYKHRTEKNKPSIRKSTSIAAKKHTGRKRL